MIQSQTDLQSAQASKAPAQIWLISFGDLLTLILGFFVAVVSQTPLNPAFKPPINQESLLQNGVEIPKSEAGTVAGTQFAKAKAKKQVFKGFILRLSERDFVQSKNSLRRRAQYQLKKRVRLVAYRLSTARIESCTEGLGNQSWLGSIERTLLIRRQLLDAGVAPRAIELGALGGNCRHFGSEATKAKLDLRLVHG